LYETEDNQEAGPACFFDFCGCRGGAKKLLLLMLVFIYEQFKMAQRIEMQICLGSSCFSRGNKDVVMFIKEYLKKNHLDDKVIFKGARCMGRCSNGPNLNINGVIIEDVTITQIESILEKEFASLI
jgi:NADH:ubiquinone oxidoreductase subunit E